MQRTGNRKTTRVTMATEKLRGREKSLWRDGMRKFGGQRVNTNDAG